MPVQHKGLVDGNELITCVRSSTAPTPQSSVVLDSGLPPLRATLLGGLQNTWFQASDLAVVIDFHPYVGDRALAVHELRKKEELGGTAGDLRYIFVNSGNFTHAMQTKFAKQRLVHQLMDQWMSGKLNLPVEGPHIRPELQTPEPTKDDFRWYTGSEAAYKGVHTVQFKAMQYSGGKVLLRHDRQMVFSSASPQVAEQLAQVIRGQPSMAMA